MTSTANRPRRRAPETHSPAQDVVLFLLAGVITLLVVAAATVWAVHDHARNEAISSAKDITAAQGRIAVLPHLSNVVVQGDATAMAQLDSVVRDRVLSWQLVRVKLWDATGRVVYSDRADLIGQRFSLEDEAVGVLRNGGTYAGVSDLAKPENRDERSYGKLLEVYDRLQAPGQAPVLFEAYLRYQPVQANQQRVLRSLAPAILGSLLVLFALQLPLAWSLASRLREEKEARARLAEQQRDRLTHDLHDSLVQSLAGTAYSLAGTARRIEVLGLEHESSAVREAASTLRHEVEDLLDKLEDAGA